MRERDWVIIGIAAAAIVAIMASSAYQAYSKPKFSPGDNNIQCDDGIDNDNDGFVDFDGNGDIAKRDLECQDENDDGEGE